MSRTRDDVRIHVLSIDRDGRIGRGLTDEGQSVAFCGEPRMMWRIACALEAGDSDVVATAPAWSVLSWGDRPDVAS